MGDGDERSDEDLDHPVYLPPAGRARLSRQRRRRRHRAPRAWSRPGRRFSRAKPNAAPQPPDDTGSIYISADDPRPILEALAELGEVYGFTALHLGEPELGSWFQRLGLVFRPGAREKLADLAARAERAAELHAILQVRSQNDEREANAVGRLIEALGGTETAVIQISSIIVVKVDGVIVSKVLTEEQVKHLSRNPDLLKDPRAVLDALKQEMPLYADGGRPRLGPATEGRHRREVADD
ncbi:hypothetical protein AB0425_36720 [Actinosynnema sp. NPDC051121]